MERHIFRQSVDPSICRCSICNEIGVHTNHTVFPSQAPTIDPINPPYYTYSKTSAADVSEDWGLNFRLFSVLKYIQRHQRKGNPLQDLEKAQWYLTREIAKMKEASDGPKTA